MSSNSNIPQLRFPGFAEEWVDQELREIGPIITGSTPSRQIKEFWGGDFCWTTAQDMKEKYILDTKEKVTEEGKKQCRVLPPNSVLVTCIASIGLNAITKIECATNQQINAIVAQDEYMAEFIYQSMEANVQRLKALAGQTAVPIINKQHFCNFIISLPPKKEERNKIAECLAEVDNLITAQGEKVDALKEKKKGMMQQMFPQKGETTPRLRFPGFTGEWEEKQIGDSFDERVEKNRGDLNLLSLGEDGLILQSDTARKDNSNADKTKYLRVAIGDIAYNTMRMWQGRCVYASIEGIVSPAYTVCKPKEFVDGLFHYYLFKTQRMIQVFHQHSQGLVSDTLNLKYEAFSKIKYFLPSTKSEQKKIAECLSAMDEMIASESAKLDALKDHKKGLMQQLFPQPNK